MSREQLAEYCHDYVPKPLAEWDWTFIEAFPLSQIVPREEMSFWQDQYDRYLRSEGQSFAELERTWLDNPLAVGPVILSHFSRSHPTMDSDKLNIEDGNHRIAISVRRRLKNIPVILAEERGPPMKNKKRYPKLAPGEKKLASRYIAEEVETGQYPRKQAIAIGISRARTSAKKHRPMSKIARIMAKYT